MRSLIRELRRVPSIAALFLVAGCAADVRPGPSWPGVTAMQPPDVPARSTALPNTGSAATVRIPPEIARECGILEADTYVEFDAARPTDFDLTGLDELAACFASGPMKGHQFRLVGHSDPRGAPDYKRTLGQARADAVETYLEAHGLPRGGGSTSSRGDEDATGRDEVGWSHDRVVDVVLQ
ncbi:MAG TPA: OmpA family protein [Polyangiaceae bacterium]